MEQLFDSTLTESERETENVLRPQNFDDYVGQDRIKENLRIYIKAALSRGDSLDHVLLYGPPGLGKTTLAHIIANEMKVPITVTSGSSITNKYELSSMLAQLRHNEVLFIDEIHRLGSSLEEILYPAMEDFRLDIITKGLGSTQYDIKLEHFTLVGATTKAGNLASPLRDRFGMQMRLVMYTPEQLCIIIKKSAAKLNVSITDEAAIELAKRSRGTPRIANRMLKRVRDFAQVLGGSGVVDVPVVFRAMELMEVDEIGLDSVDKNLLNTIIDKFSGGPVGLDTLAAATGEDAATIEDVHEPYLIQLGFVARTPRGRVCMPNAYRHLGKKLSRERLEALAIFDDGLTDEDK